MTSTESTIEKWLKLHAGGYAGLSAKERQAIHDFSLLWSLFEARVLSNNANIPRIRERVAQAASIGAGIDAVPFQESLAYFTARYYTNGDFNHRFEQLRFQNGPNGGRAEAEAVLTGTQITAPGILTGLLAIIYRLRNNLFHGEKWAYYFEEQLDNFTHACIVLMRTIEMFEQKGLLTVPE
ncbi:MAG: hypothetical protein U0975_13880 [Erythrobacter sp.]|nr:hypothetical protein [Erythrobacter sp.]